MWGNFTFQICVVHQSVIAQATLLLLTYPWQNSFTDPGSPWHCVVPLASGVMTADDLVELLCEQLARHWPRGGPSQRLLVNHMNKTLQVVESSCGDGSSSCDESPVTSLKTKPAGGLLVNA